MKIQSILLISGCCLFLTLSRCTPKEEKNSNAAEITDVQVSEVKSLQPSTQTVLPAELKPWDKVSIYPKVKGYIEQVNVDRGTIVKKGQLLAMLVAPELVSQLNHVKAQLSSAQAALIEQSAKQKSSRLNYQRMEETGKTAGAVSANELDLMYSKMRVDSALAVAAESNLNAAKASYAAQEQLVDYLTVRAPFAGIITERNISPGALVGSSGNEKPMFILEDYSKLRLTVAIPENLSNSIPEKSEVHFSVSADPLKVFTGHFARSANTLMENNRTMMTEFDVDNRSGELKSGMYAEVTLPVSRNKPTLFVLKTTLINSTEGVFVVKIKDNTADWVKVQKGNVADSLVEVFGPLKAGDKLVKNAYEELRNGQKLKVTQ